MESAVLVALMVVVEVARVECSGVVAEEVHQVTAARPEGQWAAVLAVATVEAMAVLAARWVVARKEVVVWTVAATEEVAKVDAVAWSEAAAVMVVTRAEVVWVAMVAEEDKAE